MAESDLELQQLIVQDGQPISQISDIILISLFGNNEQNLVNALAQASKDDIMVKNIYPRPQDCGPISKNIIAISCCAPDISENTFEILFQYLTTHFPNQDFDEEGWSYRHPIHFVGYSANASKLRTVINILGDRNKVNALSLFSENVLHVLLTYGRRQRMFNVQLSNGWESNIFDVVAEEESEVIECAKLLIDAGIDVNHNNIWNETPLTIAIKFKLLKVIELILKTENVELDTCKDSSTGKSARDLLREYGICLELLTTNNKSASPEQILFTYLKAEEEELFLR